MFLMIYIEAVYIMSSLDLYKTFYTVARLGSITKAAEEMFLTQPSVSYAIKQLEEQLHAKLFVRKSKGVVLTQEGDVLLRHVSAALESIAVGEKAMEQFRQLERGEVRIGTSDTLCKYFLLPHLESFHHAYPDISIHLSHGKTPDIVSWLKEGRIDCGIVHLPVDEDWFEVTEIAAIQDCFAVGERYKHLAEGSLPLRKVLEHPLIVLSKNSNTRNFIDTIVQEHGLTLSPEIELGSVELLIEFARIGLGISFLSREFITEHLREGTLFEVATYERIPPRKVGIAIVRGVPLPLAARKLVEVMRK
jgi:LysR family cyn operon transcriptional activator